MSSRAAAEVEDVKEGEDSLKYESDLLNKAYAIARKAHKGQVDKAGVDYIEHPVTVASFVDTEEAQTVALLHDTLEDSDLTAEDLLAAGIPERVVKAVELLTKPRKLSYFRYIERVKTNELSRKVKLADLKHNADLSRIPVLTEKDYQRLEKYQRAMRFLQDEEAASFKTFEQKNSSPAC